MSRERNTPGRPTGNERRRPHERRRYASRRIGPARSKSHGTPRNFMHENRETSLVSVRETAADRRAKVRRKARAHAGEESDRGVLPMNRPNKESQLSAEGGEGSPRIKENASPTHTSPTQSGEHVTQGLAGVRQAALTLASKIRAVCGKSARTDLCGGHRATDVPTATPHFCRPPRRRAWRLSRH